MPIKHEELRMSEAYDYDKVPVSFRKAGLFLLIGLVLGWSRPVQFSDYLQEPFRVKSDVPPDGRTPKIPSRPLVPPESNRNSVTPSPTATPAPGAEDTDTVTLNPVAPE